MSIILYIVVPCYNEDEVLPASFTCLHEKLRSMIEAGQVSENSKILFVDDGSQDNTWNLICDLQEKHGQNIAGLKLSRNCGHQNALYAGLMYAKDKSDCAVSIDADLQDDISVIDKMVADFNNGSDIVYAVRNKRENDNFFKRRTALTFYSLLKFMGVDIVHNHADYRLMSKRALEKLSEYNEVNLFMRGVVKLIGFKSSFVYYERKKRMQGESKYPLLKMLSFACDGITSFSIVPLYFISILGIIISVASCLGILYGLISYFLGVTVPGWAAIVTSIYFLGGVQLLCVGICGIYLGKVYSEVKARPKFFIDKIVDN